jgi:UDP:flavonoid glycosyltransferase YjiC (YdhE family)
MLALAQELVARGHHVTWLSQPSVEQRAVAAGCQFTAFDRLVNYDARTTLEEQADLAMTATTGAEIGGQLLAVVDDEHIDAVILDCNLAGAAAAVETLDLVSAVLLHSMYKTFTDVWLGELWPFMAPAINATRHLHGLDPAGSWADVFAGHDRLISVVPASFDAPVAATPATLRHFGFLVPTAPRTTVAARFPGSDDGTVLVSLSTTYQHQEELLAKIIGALAGRPVRAIVTTADAVDPANLSASSNVTIFNYLHHGLVLADTDVLITHAGLGTVASGLSHGVPMVCVPLGRDQHLNAERVADLGAGIALPTDVSSDRIGEALDQVLADASYRDSAREIASVSLASGGAAAAVDDLESLLLA